MKTTPKTIAAGVGAVMLVWLGSVLTSPAPDRAPSAGGGAREPAPVTTTASSAATPPPTTSPAPRPLITPTQGPLIGPGQAATRAATETVPAKTGAVSCKLAASQLADALATTGSDAQWVAAMRPVVTGRIEDVLGTVDRSAIPQGRATVGAVWDQPGSCDVILQWPGTAWSVTFTDQGAGYLAEDWRPA